MTDFFWPSQLAPSSSSWSLVANTAAFTSPLSGTTRTLARGGDRWRCSLTFDNLRDDKRARLQAFLAQLRGQANRVYVVDHSYRKRGTFPSVNLLPDFSSASVWTPYFATLAVNDNVARITASSGAASYRGLNFSSIPVTTGAKYAVRGFFVRSSTGTASMSAELNVGATGASASTSAGLKTASATASGSSGTAYFTVDSTGSTTAAGDFADLSYVSMGRCMTVSGGSQTGSVLTVADADNAGYTLLAGDRIEVNGEYHMVADTMIPNGSGVGKVFLTRPLRTSPANGAPVIIHDPACRMVLADNTVSWSNMPGRFSSFTVELVEDLL